MCTNDRRHIYVIVALNLCAFAQNDENPHNSKEAKYQSAFDCKACHPGIYDIWKKSLHADAVSDPVFQAAFVSAIAKYGPDTRAYCLSCHSPTTMITKDYDLNEPISREGVTCDFCHTITNVVEARPQKHFDIQIGNTKFGPLQGVDPIGGLEFRYSVLHQSSMLCSGCHELESIEGVKILGTYSEWKEGPYAARNIHCQNCHMPEQPGVPVVDDTIRKSSHNAHAHEFLGGHSQIRLEKSATVTVTTKSSGDSVVADVYVTNSEAGHYLPTGIPTRKLVLTVTLQDENGNVTGSFERFFEKILADKKGNEITETEVAMMEAAKILKDTRLKPKETWHEQFTFTGIQKSGAYVVNANLKYKFAVAVLERNVMSVEVANASRAVTNLGNQGVVIGQLIVAIAIALVVLVTTIAIGAKIYGKKQ